LTRTAGSACPETQACNRLDEGLMAKVVAQMVMGNRIHVVSKVARAVKLKRPGFELLLRS